MRKNNLTQFLIFVGCNIFIFIIIVFLGRLLATVFVFLKIGSFLFDWKETVFISLEKGVAIGFTLGLGLCIKARLQERQSSKKN
ncbi:hypothetical protein [Enterobacter asburiae]|uniref:hypothetical protein n=1 Tax=Enterobacter asburiae TaxID=61645 RepID=UPI001CBD3648|nr:hypothetical protein [Enterobacter asburiae]UAN18752.1 hypothetical protein KGP20_25145 [Enterobacter asburiae]